MATSEDFTRIVQATHRALDSFAKGDPEPFFELFSRREDVTLANPFGPPARGRDQIEEAGRRAAAHYRDGKALAFDSVATCVTPDLAYIVQIERFEAKVGGDDQVSPISLRVTTVFRPEDGAWKIVHRHADPITTQRAAQSVVQT